MSNINAPNEAQEEAETTFSDLEAAQHHDQAISDAKKRLLTFLKKGIPEDNPVTLSVDVYDVKYDNARKQMIKATIKWIGGDVSDGWFYKGELTGNGKHTLRDGTVFEGEWEKDILVNTAKKTLPDGTVFEGIFIGHEIHGKGKKTLSNGTMFEGEWEKGILVKMSKKTLPDGTVFEGGVIIDNKVYGEAKKTLRNGNFEKGRFRADVLKVGKKVSRNNKFVEEGTFVDGKLIFGTRTTMDDNGLITKEDVFVVPESDE